MRKPIPLPDYEVLHELLELREDYTLWWKERPEKYGNHEWFNSNHAGTQAFTSLISNYYVGAFLNKKYKAHRIIWKMIYGTDPDYIDHIDGDTKNNSIENLRSVNPETNSRNISLSHRNTSGYIGVCFDKLSAIKPWKVQISFEGKKIRVGSYATIEEAIEARKAAEIKYGYHANHGRSHTMKEKINYEYPWLFD